MNPRGHEEDSGLHSHTKNLTNTSTNFCSWTSLARTLKGRRKKPTGNRKMRMGEVREMGAPSSYLTGLLHILSFAPGYK